MARKIATILESGDPTQKGSSKFEKQRERADKYTIESDATNYRPLRPLQTESVSSSSYTSHQQSYYNAPNVPTCIKHSLDEAQYINPLRYVGAPEEFKQIHMQVGGATIDWQGWNARRLGTCHAYQCASASGDEYCG